mgnify:CR=1 FL=1
MEMVLVHNHMFGHYLIVDAFGMYAVDALLYPHPVNRMLSCETVTF